MLKKDQMGVAIVNNVIGFDLKRTIKKITPIDVATNTKTENIFIDINNIVDVANVEKKDLGY
jgi:hypothetical protein